MNNIDNETPDMFFPEAEKLRWYSLKWNAVVKARRNGWVQEFVPINGTHVIVKQELASRPTIKHTKDKDYRFILDILTHPDTSIEVLKDAEDTYLDEYVFDLSVNQIKQLRRVLQKRLREHHVDTIIKESLKFTGGILLYCIIFIFVMSLI